jgi:uncharacterized membrane protein YgcG
MATASMSDRRQALAALAASRSGSGEGRGWKRAALIILILLLAAAFAAWALGFFSPPRELVALERLVDVEITKLNEAARAGTPVDAAAGFGAVMQQMRELPREYREQAGRQMGRLFEARERADMASYFALPADKRQAELDRRIKAEEDRRKAWQAERAKREQAAPNGQVAANGGDGGGSGGQGGPPGGGAPGGGGPPGAGPPGGRRGGGTEESRNERMKQQIDRTTPEQRAQRAEYRRAIEERRQQLGLGPGRRT